MKAQKPNKKTIEDKKAKDEERYQHFLEKWKNCLKDDDEKEQLKDVDLVS